MRRTLLALALLAVVAFGAVTWVEDTCFRNERLDSTFSGRYILAPGDSTPYLTLPYYPWTQLWVYALAETLTPSRGDDFTFQIQWRYGTYDPYAKPRDHFYWSAWAQALPNIWAWLGSYPDSIEVFDSLYLGPLYDPNVPLAWVDRVQLRVVAGADTSYDSVSVRLWARRRQFTEAGDVLQWPWFFFPGGN